VIDDSLRHAAAHVIVADVEDPVLGDDAIHHLARVLRLRRGEPVTVTDGAGRWRPGVFTDDGVDAVGAIVDEPRPDPPIAVAVAPPKGDRLDWLVAKCTEVGVDQLVLVDAERSVVRWPPDRVPRQIERLERIAAEAAMQSRRVWLPEICAPVRAVDVLPRFAAAEPGGRALAAGDTAIAIGPEGGWSPAELRAAASTVSLAANVLRVETAAVAATVLMVSVRT
jgi:16S rRNA (uracil1498-N3)-methyltransferase